MSIRLMNINKAYTNIKGDHICFTLNINTSESFQ